NGSDAPGVVVYNAALMESDGLLTSSLERLEHAHAVNVVGAIATAQAVVPAMRAAGAGTLLYTGGGLADSPEPTIATLSLGKVALRAMTTMLATELSKENIHAASVTVNGRVAPGTAFDPDHIADFYWEIHSQPRQQWRSEHRFDGR
ncbi:MAG: SDR family NAD(P)-dependent oxidoreductase, partial [Solirubrobacteraceae bacterium]